MQTAFKTCRGCLKHRRNGFRGRKSEHSKIAHDIYTTEICPSQYFEVSEVLKAVVLHSSSHTRVQLLSETVACCTLAHMTVVCVNGKSTDSLSPMAASVHSFNNTFMHPVNDKQGNRDFPCYMPFL